QLRVNIGHRAAGEDAVQQQVAAVRIAAGLEAADDVATEGSGGVEIAEAAVETEDVGAPPPQRARHRVGAITHLAGRFEHAPARRFGDANVAGAASKDGRDRHLAHAGPLRDLAHCRRAPLAHLPPRFDLPARFIGKSYRFYTMPSRNSSTSWRAA